MNIVKIKQEKREDGLFVCNVINCWRMKWWCHIQSISWFFKTPFQLCMLRSIKLQDAWRISTNGKLAMTYFMIL